MPLLEARGITKIFPNVVANDHVDLVVDEGEILGLVGENGAGKTTLMRIIYGLERPNAGEIFWKGKMVSINSPQDAMQLGIGMVHQHFQLFPSLSVTENVVLGNEPRTGPFLNRRQAYERIKELIQRFGFALDLKAPVRSLSVGQQQKVELLKALYRHVKLLILDEPTAVLTPQEVDSLMELLRQLAASGIAIILISHKLREVLGVASRITVMRNGRVVANMRPTEVTEDQLASLIVGMELQGLGKSWGERREKRREPVLVVQNLSVLNDRGRIAVDNITFELSRGEILGIAGVEGNGQQELVEALIGVRRVLNGKIFLNGKEITRAKPVHRRRLGLAAIPGDRVKEGTAATASVAENLITTTYRRFPYSFMGVFRERNIREFARMTLEKFRIIAEPTTITRTLSGGNLQRLVIARELSTDPLVLIAVHPSRGLDVQSMVEVHRHLINLRNQGRAVLLISTDLDELLALSDRLLVIFRGRIVGEVSPRATTLAELGLLMLGGTIAQAHEGLSG
ncbi:MAG: ABC transporter ATP-binding protein [Candidatus Hadarchaeum sp.]|uniref:ABC transporter ATP-binding protein n=1 Tax=Candidatus Hadarchaeum sp. TaxID=2883567 RepID=UPI003D12789D